MTKNDYDKILKKREKRLKAKENELLEFFCDRCHHTFAASDQDELDAQCDQCPVEGLVRNLVTEAEEYGSLEACRRISVSCEELANDLS